MSIRLAENVPKSALPELSIQRWNVCEHRMDIVMRSLVSCPLPAGLRRIHLQLQNEPLTWIKERRTIRVYKGRTYDPDDEGDLDALRSSVSVGGLCRHQPFRRRCTTGLCSWCDAAACRATARSDANESGYASRHAASTVRAAVRSSAARARGRSAANGPPRYGATYGAATPASARKRPSGSKPEKLASTFDSRGTNNRLSVRCVRS
jgi:hypothetical protein